MNTIANKQFEGRELQVSSYYALSLRAKDAIEYNKKAGDQKSSKIAKAFRWSFPAMALFVASLLLAMFNVYSNIKHDEDITKAAHLHSKIAQEKERSVTMTEQEQSNSSTPKQPQVQPQTQEPSPNPDIQASQNVLITEGHEPPKSKADEHK